MKRAVLLITIITLTFMQMNAQKSHQVDVSASQIFWTGKKVTGQHTGIVELKKGWISFDEKTVSGGEFVVDMSTIRDTDLKDDKTREMLENHLKSDDFFGVAKYPEAKLVISETGRYENGKAVIKGLLTIKGKTNPVEFEATAVREGGLTTFAAVITIDRTLYDVRYGSGKFFTSLGDKVIYDDFTLDVRLVVEN